MSFPTEPVSQFGALFASVRPDKPPVPDLKSMLQVIVDRLRTPLICDFLFANEPLHIQPFTSPEFARTSFLGELLVTRVGANSVQTEPYLLDERRQKTLGTYLFSHRITLDQLTLGVGVLEVMECMEDSNGKDISSVCSLHHDLRFMHDAAGREKLVVMDSPETDHLIIQTGAGDSSVNGYILLTTFRRRELLQLIRTQPASLNVNLLLRELIGYVHTSTIRPCPTCNVGPAAGCLCYARLLAAHRADHLFDPQLYKFSMTQDCGDYDGVTSKALYDRGKRVSRAKLGAFLSYRGGFDETAAQRLRTWSLTKFARGMRENPMQSTRLLGPGDGHSRFEGSLWVYEQDNFGQKQIELSPIEVLEPLLDQLNSIHIEDEEDAVGETTGEVTGYPSFLSEPVQISFAGPDTPSTTTPLTGILVSPPSLSMDQPSDGIEWFKSPLSVETNSAESPDRVVGSSSFEADSLVVALPEQSGNLAFSLGRNENAGSILKDLQAARRRVRNRASANRSNQRKRAVRDKVAAELNEMKERSEALREEEMRLRTENMELRRRVRDRDMSSADAVP